MTETEFQAVVIDLARMFRWRVAHFRPAKTKHGWVTPIQADGKGWPDLCLVRERIIFAELKSDAGKLAPEQREWAEALADAGCEHHVWRPCDLELIAAVLRERRAA